MRKDQTSTSAMGIAILRAIESNRPEDERICFDPYARQMVSSWMLAMGEFFTDIGYASLRGPGVQGFLAARERFIDDYLKQCLVEGLEQLVILGAGYDARAYRFDELKHGVKIFEVDLPATQQLKLARLRKIFGQVPGYVTFVPIDFNRESLEQRLLECGYDRSRKTLFIWQGVVCYLDPASVDGTLRFIAQNSPQGSSVIFDYTDLSTLEGAKGHGEVSGMRRYRAFTGEAPTFGIPDGTVENFLTARGFRQVRDIASEDLKSLYFTGKNQTRKVLSGYGIVSAVVA